MFQMECFTVRSMNMTSNQLRQMLSYVTSLKHFFSDVKQSSRKIDEDYTTKS